MSFVSLAFFIFLPAVFACYWALAGRIRLQNLLVVAASYVFYGWWNWRFCGLMAFSSATAYFAAIAAAPGEPAVDARRNRRRVARKAAVFSCCAVNLGILGFFKYWGFFAHEAASLLSSLGFQTAIPSLRVILPVGISFYTFQAIGYAIDAYRGRIRPAKDPVAFFAFISFFPQLVAGPIERASNLLPQFLSPRKFDYPLAVEGCRQMLWGFFKKLLVADTCAYAANMIIESGTSSAPALWIAMTCFAFQIYGDFSGYSDIAIGCGKLFGIRLMRNFAYPYFSRDIAEFWRRWHMSLTTWFRDYLYIPLGGSRCGTARKIRNTFAIFAVSGIWHGASWTFLAWGLFHAVCFLPLFLAGKNRKYASGTVADGRMFPAAGEAARMAAVFTVVIAGWTFFRAPDISTAWRWLSCMFSFSNVSLAGSYSGNALLAVKPLCAMLAIEWISRKHELPVLPKSKLARWAIYVAVFSWIVYSRRPSEAFIYFRF